MTTKEKDDTLAEQDFGSYEDFLSKCFPDDSRVRRVAASKLGQRWAKEALARLRKQIETGDLDSIPTPSVSQEHPPHSHPLARRRSSTARRAAMRTRSR